MEGFDSAATKEEHVRICDAELSGEGNSRHDSFKHVVREPTIGSDFQSIKITKDGSTMTSIDKLTTKEATGGATFVHSKVMLQFVNNNVMSLAITNILLIVVKEDDMWCALDAKISTVVSAE